jgi:two-component system, LytTR family, sensor kinase
LKINNMLYTIYRKYQYFFNMLAVLLFLTMVRTLDSFAWVPPAPNKAKIILLNYMFEFFTFIPVIFILIFSYRWTVKRNLTFLLYSLIFAFVVLMPSLVLFLSTWLEVNIGGLKVQPITFDLIEKYTPGVSLVILFLSAAYYITHLVLTTARQRETAHKAESLAKDVQLKMLRYQINPHFLFNVLNSIYTLIDENTEKAKKLVIDMSEYYRYTLNKQQHTISIEKEVESIAKYLEIQKTRFEEEFHYEITVEEAAKSALIPSFLIHLLIENAVKYGTRTVKDKLIICLSVKLVSKALLIKVSNTGKLLNPTPEGEKNVDGTGNGIENLKNRLSLYYDNNYSFSLKEEDGCVVADIEIININTR